MAKETSKHNIRAKNVLHNEKYSKHLITDPQYDDAAMGP